MRRHAHLLVVVMAVLASALAGAATAAEPRAEGQPYAGPLYSVSEKVGDNPLVLTRLLRGMKRNQVTTAVLYFGIERARDAHFVEDVLRAAPGTVVPFVSTGIGGAGEGKRAGAALARMYSRGLSAAREQLGRSAIRGIGEVEIYAWPMAHDDERVIRLVDVAARNGLAVMTHPARGRLAELEALVRRYPQTPFLIHMFAPDVEADRQAVIDLMTRQPNVHYTVDVDHMLFDRSGRVPIGLLYKYQHLPPAKAAVAFQRDFDANRDRLLAESAARYLPLVQAHPDRILWGTEMSADYTYDPGVYDRVIGFARDWISTLPEDARSKVAFDNARRLLGAGVVVR